MGEGEGRVEMEGRGGGREVGEGNGKSQVEVEVRNGGKEWR